jgi:hypothetical protein
MEDLVKQLKDKAGLTDEQVVITIQTMKEYIHSKVPPMFSGFVDKFFAKNNVEQEEDPLA